MRDGQTQEFVGIDWRVIDADFVVQMWTGTATAQPDVSDRVATAYILSGNYRIAGQMPVARRDAVAVVQRDRSAVSSHEVGEHYHTVGRSHHWLPIRSRYIDSTMKCALTVERINSLSKRTRNRTFHRPKVGSRIGP